MNQLGQVGTAPRVIIGLNTVDVALPSGIKMDAYEYGVGLSIRYRQPCIKRNKHVRRTRKHRMKAAFCQAFL
jgi:hypothetical protein